MKAASPTLKLVGADTVRSDIMKHYDIARAVVVDFLAEFPGMVSFTMDGWSSMTMAAFLALTIHFIDQDWNLCSFVLDFIPHRGDHSGYNMAQTVYASLKKFGVHKKLLTFTLDNASSNDTFMDSLEDLLDEDMVDWCGKSYRMRCFSHVLNLAVQDGVTHESIEPLVTKITSMVRYIRASGQRLDKLKKYCDDADPKIKYVKPVLPVVTRWNSVLFMLISVLRTAKV